MVQQLKIPALSRNKLVEGHDLSCYGSGFFGAYTSNVWPSMCCDLFLMSNLPNVFGKNNLGSLEYIFSNTMVQHLKVITRIEQ